MRISDWSSDVCSSDLMAARVEVLLRRSRGKSGPLTKLRVGDLELDLMTRHARRGERDLELLPTEFRLLEFMMRNSGQVLTRMMIFEAVWGFHFDPGTNLIDVHFGRLRKKVAPPGNPPFILPVRGTGHPLTRTNIVVGKS